MTIDSIFRRPSNQERALLNRLLEASFPGRDELALALGDVEVNTIDENGSLQLHSTAINQIPVVKRIPVEAEAADEDGITIHVLLHVIQGRPSELEIYKDDSSPVKRMPAPSKFELLVLPPVPNPKRI